MMHSKTNGPSKTRILATTIVLALLISSLPFSINITSAEAIHSDLGSSIDAGSSVETASYISTQDASTGYLDESDNEDVYGIYVRADETIIASIIAPAGADYELRLLDSTSTELTSSALDNDGTENISYLPAYAGYYYLKVVRISGSGDYSLTASIINYNLASVTSVTDSVSDADGDGDYDNLLVNVNLNVVVASTYTFYAYIYDNEKTYMTYVASERQLSAGPQTVTLNIKGSTIYNLKKDGPYSIDISFYDENLNHAGAVTHRTSAYSYASFDNSGITRSTTAGGGSNAIDNKVTVDGTATGTIGVSFSPPHSDNGLDKDGDGYYDSLVVNVNLNVTTAGNYNISATLYGSDGYTYINYKTMEVSLATGVQTVAINFDGEAINKSKINGPYITSIDAYDSNWYGPTSSTYTTSPETNYTYDSFAPSGASLAPPFSDRGLDNDGDGVYDYLVVDLKINVSKAGKYYIGGSLYGGSTTYASGGYTYTGYGTYIGWAWQEVYLSSGEQTIPLYFDGSAIKRSAVNGPYSANVYIYNESYSSYDWGDHTTATYTYSQFGKVASGFSTGHSDSGADTDGDGLYDYLDVTVNLNIATAGNYSVSGSLSGGASDYATTTYGAATTKTTSSGYTYVDYAWKDAELSKGSQSVTLRFDGSKIRKSKVDGPYTVSLSLMKDYEWVDSTSYTTTLYTYTQFQMAAVSFAQAHSDKGSDTNGDGLYDYLLVDVVLNVTKAGTYSLSGSLMSGSGSASLSGGSVASGSTTATATSTTSTSLYAAETTESTSSGSSSGPTPTETTGEPLPAKTDYSYRSYTYYVDSAWSEAELATGTQTVQLKFDGRRIRQAGANGPYTVDLYVYGPHVKEYNTYSYDWGTSDYSTYTTSSYTYDQFQTPAASFSPPHSDNGLDNDGDGKYDYLVVEAKVNVTTAGRYNLNASLMGGSSVRTLSATNSSDATYSPNVYIDYVWTEADLAAGVQTVELRFDGIKIKRSGVDGPYQVSLSLNDSDWEWLDYDIYNTSAYSNSSFQSPPISITSATDNALDIDNNGLNEYLEVNVGVDVRTAGDYLFMGTITPSYYGAVLASDSGIAAESATSSSSSATATTSTSSVAAIYTPVIAMKEASLGTGAQTVTLRFPGGLIYQSSQNGPYMISLTIVKDFKTWTTLDDNYYETSTAYKYTNFEQPVAVLSPPHSDSGSDTDNDGYYDKLVLDAHLDVSNPGNLKIASFLMDEKGDIVDRKIKDLTLAAGNQVVSIEFDGWKVYSSHVQGSMTAGILLLDPNVTEEVWYTMGEIKVPLSGWVDVDMHTTGTYSYDQFESMAPEYSAILRRLPIALLSAGQATNIDLENHNLPTLGGVRIAASENGVTPTITVTEGTELPPLVSELGGEVISYITIEIENAEGMSFVLRIPRERLENLGINSDNIVVYRFEDNWSPVDVVKTGEDDEYYYYEVTTPGFSLFGVTSGSTLPTLPTQPISQLPPIYIIMVAAILLVVVTIAIVWRYIYIGGRSMKLPRK